MIEYVREKTNMAFLKDKHPKGYGILVFLSLYSVAYLLGFFGSAYETEVLLRLLVWDLISTLVIWLFSLLLKNSSLYDAYWSLTPFVFCVYLAICFWPLDLYRWLFLASFSFWSWRLTIHWMVTFGGIHWEDWRYQSYRKNNPPWLWHLINLFGIQLMPTLLVYLAFLPVVVFLSSSASWTSLLGSALSLTGALLELFADYHLTCFLKDTASLSIRPVCQKGLWRYSRHPNYLGEILLWAGAYLAMMTSARDSWYYGLGALLVFCLFEFISIPLMEKRQISRRPDYVFYKESTSRLLILPKRK